jgi:Methyltransferase domain
MRKDLLFQDEIRNVVARAYSAIPSGGGKDAIGRFYDDEQLADLPHDAIAWALGVGNPVRHAGLVPGEVVLDLGCGAGIDTILAAREVGPSGRVIGLDMLDEMCWRAHATANAAGVAGCTEFKRGEMEAIPGRVRRCRQFERRAQPVTPKGASAGGGAPGAATRWPAVRRRSHGGGRSAARSADQRVGVGRLNCGRPGGA